MRSTRPSYAFLLAVSLGLLHGCGSPETGDSTPTGAGGSAPAGASSTTSTGGETGIGGANASGGLVGAGGDLGSGGAAPSSGGATSTGGQTGTGGASVSGGAPASGGAGTGGLVGAGGTSVGGAEVGGAGGAATGGASTGGQVGAGGAGVGGAAGGGAGDAATGGATEPGTGGATVITACSTGTAQPGDVTVTISSLQQRISGFGVSSAWAGDFRDPENDPDMLWSTTTGAGLTLHRIRIGGGTTSETRIAQRAVEYGVRVWATPWEVNEADTDRPMCPTNDPCDPPPKLTNPEDWVNRLVDFVTTMEEAGVPVYAISAENEPDSGGMNHTVSFTATELAEWIESFLRPRAMVPLTTATSTWQRISWMDIRTSQPTIG
jgi:hypothetical protein